MADASASDLNDFLGVRPVPVWRRYLKWVFVAIGVVLLVLLLLRIFSPAAKTEYATETAQKGTLTVIVSATGKLAPTNQVNVGSELSGLVVKVLVDVNDRVVAGQTIALIDPARFQDSVNQSRAALAANVAAVAQARATLAQSIARLSRFEEVSRLSGGRVPAKTEMETAVADRDRAIANLHAADANVGSARAALSSNDTQLVRAIILSPVNGVVLARQIEPGATVAAAFNTPTLFVIAEDLSQMKLEVAIDEADVGQVKEGQRADFTVDAFPGRTFPATITRVDLGSNLTAQTTTTGSSQQVVSYSAKLSVSNPDQLLRPGMTATADITTSSRVGILLVPNPALRFKPDSAGGKGPGIASSLIPRPRPGAGARPRVATIKRGAEQSIYIQDADGNPKKVDITTGATDGLMTEVLSGDLRPGQMIITGVLTKEASAAKAAGKSGSSGGSRGQ